MEGWLSIAIPLISKVSGPVLRTINRFAAVLAGLLVLLGWYAGRDSADSTWLPFAVGILGSVIVVAFWWRQHRLERGVDATAARLAGESVASTEAATTSDSQELTVRDSTDNDYHGPDPQALAEEARIVENNRRRQAAREASQNKRDTYMARLEAGQRAAIEVAGGIENAPYLKDDLRITLLATLSLLAWIPFGLLFVIIAGIIVS